MSRKLYESTQRDWEESLASETMTTPNMERFIDFLTNKCNLCRALNRNTSIPKPPPNKTKNFVSSNKEQCSFFKSSHFVTQCESLTKLKINDRIRQIKEKRFCFNCLRKGHDVSSRKSKMSCKSCHKRYHTLFHIESLRASDSEPSTFEVTLTNNATTSHFSQTLLSTVCVLVKDGKANWHECRVLLDSGSQSSFITQEFHKKLKVASVPIQTTVLDINQAGLNIRQKVELTFRATHTQLELKIGCHT